MKATLEFNLPEEQEEFEIHQKAMANSLRLDYIWNVIFRPYYKHGYDDAKLNELLETEGGKYIMEALVKLYRATDNS